MGIELNFEGRKRPVPKRGREFKVYLLGDWESLGFGARVFGTLILQSLAYAERVIVLESSRLLHWARLKRLGTSLEGVSEVQSQAAER